LAIIEPIDVKIRVDLAVKVKVTTAVFTARFMNDWNIQSRAHHCQACGKAFQDQRPYHTLLFDGKEAYIRKDICDACWKSEFNSGMDDSPEQGFLSYWQGIYQVPPPKAPEPIKKETAETLLRKLTERNDRRFAPAAFILAVMLERKRLLKIQEQFQRDGQRVFVYEEPASGDLFTIVDPDLHLNQLEEVQRTVSALLEHGLTPEGDIAEPAEPSPETGRPGGDPSFGSESNAGPSEASGQSEPAADRVLPPAPRPEEDLSQVAGGSGAEKPH
jgi:hypothetical protein